MVYHRKKRFRFRRRFSRTYRRRSRFKRRSVRRVRSRKYTKGFVGKTQHTKFYSSRTAEPAFPPGSYSLLTVRLNNCWRAIFSAGSTEPLGYSRAMLFYYYSTVLGTKVTLKMFPTHAENTVPDQISQQPVYIGWKITNSSSSPTYESFRVFQEDNYKNLKVIQGLDQANSRITVKWGAKKWFKQNCQGIREYASTNATGPSNEVFLHFYFWGILSDTYGPYYTYNCMVEQACVLWQKNAEWYSGIVPPVVTGPVVPPDHDEDLEDQNT